MFEIWKTAFFQMPLLPYLTLFFAIAAKKTLELLIDLKFLSTISKKRNKFASDWHQKKKSTVLKYHVYSGAQWYSGTAPPKAASAWHLFNLSTFFEMIYQPDSFFSRLIHTTLTSFYNMPCSSKLGVSRAPLKTPIPHLVL